MSCDYFVQCIDCASRHPLGSNHGQTLMRSLVRNARAIALFAPAALDVESGLSLQTLYGSLDLSWFAEHGTHRLRVIDEYDRFDGDCPKRVRCDGCDHERWCRLSIDHAEPCRP